MTVVKNRYFVIFLLYFVCAITNVFATPMKLIFYPENYSSVGEESASWVIESLQYKDKCVLEPNFRLNALNSINVHLFENYTENTFIKSQLLRMSNFTQIINENQKFDNQTIDTEVFNLHSTKLEGIVFVMTRKDFGYTEDIKMHYSYFDGDQQQVNASQGIILDMNWKSGFIEHFYGNKNSLWGAQNDERHVKKSFLENKIHFDLQVFFNGIVHNNPRVACVYLEMYIDFNVTDYKMFKLGQYIAPETSITTSTINQETSTVLMSSSSDIQTLESSTIISETLNPNTTLKNVESSSSDQVSLGSQNTQSSDSTTLKKETSDIFHQNNINNEDIEFQSESYMFDRSFYVIVATCSIIVCCVIISIISILYYIKKSKNISKYNSADGIRELIRSNSDTPSNNVDNAHIINININHRGKSDNGRNFKEIRSQPSNDSTIYDVASPRHSDNVYDRVNFDGANKDAHYEQIDDKFGVSSQSQGSKVSRSQVSGLGQDLNQDKKKHNIRSNSDILVDLRQSESDTELQRGNNFNLHKPNDISTEKFQKLIDCPQLQQYASIPEASEMQKQLQMTNSNSTSSAILYNNDNNNFQQTKSSEYASLDIKRKELSERRSVETHAKYAPFPLQNSNTMISGVECIGPPDEEY